MPKRHVPAAEQLAVDGLLTRADLKAAELNRHLGDRAAREGRGLRVAPSTYLLGDVPTDAQLVAAAQEHAGDDLVVTGLVACRWLGMVDVPDDGRVEVLVPASRRRVSMKQIRVQPTTRPPAYWILDGVQIAEPHRLSPSRRVWSYSRTTRCSGRCAHHPQDRQKRRSPQR